MVVVRHDRKAKYELETSICKAHKASPKQFDNSTSEKIYGPVTKIHDKLQSQHDHWQSISDGAYLRSFASKTRVDNIYNFDEYNRHLTFKRNNRHDVTFPINVK